MATYEIPLKPSTPQSLSVNLPDGTFRFRFTFQDAPEGGWMMDISDNLGNPMVCGVPLVTGADLLAQYGYLGFQGKLYIVTDGFRAGVPTFDGLGVSSRLYYEI